MFLLKRPTVICCWYVVTPTMYVWSGMKCQQLFGMVVTRRVGAMMEAVGIMIRVC